MQKYILFRCRAINIYIYKELDIYLNVYTRHRMDVSDHKGFSIFTTGEP